MRIGLDIDGVIYNWEKTARYMLREVLPDSPYRSNYDEVHKGGFLYQESLSWDYIQEHVSKEHWNWLWNEGVKLGLFRHGHLYPGSIQAIRQLAEIGDVVLITHRPKQAVNDTLDWISFQRLPLAGVHLLTNQEPKSSVKPACDVYLDDKPENVTDLCRNSGAKMVGLVVRPWNINYFHPQVIDPEPKGLPYAERIRSWPEFVERVRAL